MRPKLISKLIGVSCQQVYRVKQRLKARAQYQSKRESPQHLQHRQELLLETKEAI